MTLNKQFEGGEPGNDPHASGDRHMLIVDRDNKHLYELFSVFYNDSSWQAGSGAFFDMATNGRRPQGWTSADAAGLAILPGLVRFDEVYGPDEIRHAFRVNHIVATKPPIAVISATPVSGVPPLTVTLDGSASSDVDGTIVAHAWNFGDGTTGSGARIGHVYSKPGSFTATLTVTDDHSAVSSASVTIKVTPPEGLRISLQPADHSIRVGAHTTFTVAARGTGHLKYQWQENGVDIPGATFGSYTTRPAVLNDNGSTFQCVVTDGQNTVTSHSATLTVRVRR